uniref:Uncharacterized protein n=1 Tax=Anguilla anguilla TaxID=7936 RepID=A0A0E9WPK8_ANGAN
MNYSSLRLVQDKFLNSVFTSFSSLLQVVLEFIYTITKIKLTKIDSQIGSVYQTHNFSNCIRKIESLAPNETGNN